MVVGRKGGERQMHNFKYPLKNSKWPASLVSPDIKA